MDYRYGSHTVFNIEYHFVWVAKYRYQVLKGDVALRVRELAHFFPYIFGVNVSNRLSLPVASFVGWVGPALSIDAPASKNPKPSEKAPTRIRFQAGPTHHPRACRNGRNSSAQVGIVRSRKQAWLFPRKIRFCARSHRSGPGGGGLRPA